MSAWLDLNRIAELKDLLGADLGGILVSMAESMDAAINQVEVALADGELEDAAYATHRCRNDALMVGAGRLQHALTELETAVRDHSLERSREAMARVRRLWPATLGEIERAARREHSS